MRGDAAALQAALGYHFHKTALLQEALSHSSLGGTAGPVVRDYERLEFLGDRVLGLVVAEWLLERFPNAREGELARRHTAQVQRDALANIARKISLGAHLRLSPGEETTGGRDNDTILADACEAVIGALYLDGGLAAAAAFIRRLWDERIDGDDGPPVEPKTALQEWAQGRGLPLPAYTLIGRDGPDHDPRFRVQVSVSGHGDAMGEGSAKRSAEKAAAQALLTVLQERGKQRG